FNDLSTGNIATRTWDFGDGTSSSQTNPSHAYALSGSYTVTLTASGPGGSDIETKAGLITVADPPPVAGFGAAPTSGVAPLSVQFSDTSSGKITTRLWSFGDGTTSSATSPSHVYTSPGTYGVSLSVSGPGGSDLAQKDGLVSVAIPAPVADFNLAPR